MSLRTQAAADLGTILEDTAGGFGWPITVTDPAGTSVALVGFSTDIGQTIDPETGTPVAGRSAEVSLRIGALEGAGLAIPRGISDGTGKPWLVEFADIRGKPFKFKVSASMPDRAIGVVVLALEAYQ